MDLPAFLLSKNFYSESIGMSHVGSTYGRAFNHVHIVAAANDRIGTLSGGTYPAGLPGLAFQLCLPQLPLSFCLVF